MIIEKLNLIGFGKFKNKSIEFKKGMNIVYAENEGGKTTIHRFIDGMFYGFLKPYVKSTIYLPEHKQYEPWQGFSYRGILSLEVDDTKYRIERTFTKGIEETKVILDHTGEDITHSINTGEKARILQPGYHFFGFNSSIYANTVSIRQLGVSTEDKLANEVRDKLMNITTSMDDQISIEKAINELDTRIKDIGTSKASSSPYGVASSNLIKLKEKRLDILNKHHLYDELLQEKEKLESRLDELSKRLEASKSQEKVVEYKIKKSIYQDALKETQNIGELQSKLNKYKEFKDLSNEDYSEAQEVSHDINIINSRIDDTNAQLNSSMEIMQQLLSRKMTFDETKAKELFDDFFDYEAINEEIIRLEGNIRGRNLELIIRDIEDLKATRKRYIILGIILFIIYISSSYIIMANKSLLLMMQGFWIIFGFIIKNTVTLKKRMLNLISSQQEISKDQLSIDEELRNMEAAAKEILDRNNCNGKAELREKYQRTLERKYGYEDEMKSIEEYKIKISTLNNRIQELSIKRQVMKDAVKEILIKNHSESLEEFKLGLHYKNIYEDLSIEYRNRQEILAKILGNFNIEELKKEIDEKVYLDIETNMTKEDLETSLKEINQSISEVALENKKVQTQIDMLHPEISSLVDIEEEILRNLDLIRKMDEKRESLELAKSTIRKLSSEIHTQFAPHINERVGNIINEITGGKYSSVKIDDKLNMGVVDPITGEIININSLSGGTIDQLYFSLRFGIINSITDKALPLILDDSFIQYDDSRLKNIMKLLIKVSKQRQIILFSCQKREINILRELNEEVNLITLSSP